MRNWIILISLLLISPSVAFANVVVSDVKVSQVGSLADVTGHSRIFDPSSVDNNPGSPSYGHIGVAGLRISAKITCTDEDRDRQKGIILRWEKAFTSLNPDPSLGDAIDVEEDQGRIAARSYFTPQPNVVIFTLNGESLRGGLLPEGNYQAFAACGNSETPIKFSTGGFSSYVPVDVIKVAYGSYKPSAGKDYIGVACGDRTYICDGNIISSCSETKTTLKCKTDDFCRFEAKGGGCSNYVFSCGTNKDKLGTCQSKQAVDKTKKQAKLPPAMTKLEVLPTAKNDGVTFKVTTDQPSYISIFELSDDGKNKVKQVATTGTPWETLVKLDGRNSFKLSTSHEFKVTGLKNAIGKKYSIRAGGNTGEVFMKSVTVGLPEVIKLAITNIKKTVTTTGATIEFDTSKAATATVNAEGKIAKDSAAITKHKLVLSSLNIGEGYSCTITATVGTESATANCDFTTSKVLDTTAPKISNILVDAKETSVKITWTTDETSGTFLGMDTDANMIPDASDGIADAAKRIEGFRISYLGTTSHNFEWSGLTAGTIYSYRIVSRDTTGNEANSGLLKFTTKSAAVINLPNLVPVEMSFSIAAPKPNDNIVATVTVKNTGTADAVIQPTAGFINLNVGGVSKGIYKVSTATTIAAGSSKAFTLNNAPFTFAKEGTVTASASINSDSSIKESSTADNVFKKDLVFGTPKLADLTITDATVIPTYPIVGQSASINIILSNLGTADADFSSTDGLIVTKADNIQVGTLRGLARTGSSLQLIQSWTPALDKDYALSFEADGGKVLGESNEINNALSKTVNVLSGTAECSKQADVALLNKRYLVKDKSVVLSITGKTNDVLTVKMTQSLGTSLEKSEQAQISIGSIGSFFNGGYKIKVVSSSSVAAAVSIDQCPGTIGGTGITSSGSGILGKVLNGDNFSDPFEGFMNFFKVLFGG